MGKDFSRIIQTGRAVELKPEKVSEGFCFKKILKSASYIGLTGLFLVGSSLVFVKPLTVSADTSADADLFALINQDRASNGEGALLENMTLQTIAESGQFTICGGTTVNGRSEDMLQRNYFDHDIPPCTTSGQPYSPNYYLINSNAFSAYGVPWSDWGERRLYF